MRDDKTGTVAPTEETDGKNGKKEFRIQNTVITLGIL
jgi:hypothetical protein